MPSSPKNPKKLRVLRKTALGRFSGALIRVIEGWMKRKNAIQAEQTGKRLGRTLFRLSRKHRERALSNLSLCFPELPVAERRSLALRSFEHFGMVATDFMRTKARSDEEVDSHMEVEGREHVENALANGKGILIVSAHFGNWERFAQYARTQGKQIYAVARDADDAKVQSDVSRLRELTGLQIISRGNAARTLISLLRENKIVALLPDQNSSETFIKFFGLPTGTVLGPATISLRTGAPLIPAFCARTGPGKYKTHIFPPLEPVEGIENKAEALTQAMNDAIEKIIRMYPEQWLWLHDRWKSSRRKGLL
jgi:KDO2-lipid IV(A) lauroyltransferase